MNNQQLFNEWLQFKEAEEQAKKNRKKIEIELESLYSNFEGKSKTFNEEDYKITIKKNIVHKLDQEKWKELRSSIPKHLRPEKYSLDVEGFTWLKKNDKDTYLKISDCVEIKNNKSTIKVVKK